MTEQHQQRFERGTDGPKVIVVGIDGSDSSLRAASYAAGLRPGDVVTEIDRKPVTNAEEAVKLSENVKNKSSILLRVWSKGGSHYLVVDESKVG